MNIHDDFDRHFARTERSINRKMNAAVVLGVVWSIFLMGAIGTGLFLAGRWTGVW